ncbi:hypothetical protein [Massilia timonae]|uniref:nSTAND1 domain-containing NTPase n=1 Tax=Massilia timonae TaxID=47229 RepID=UPI0023548B32|nr:hypothetical protein [Massilia timonae]
MLANMFRAAEPSEVYRANTVFTPSVPAKITFVDRDVVNDKLVNALETPGKQLVVYGHSGSGKTTLVVNKLQQLYEGHVTSRCMKGTTLEGLVRDAFDQLDVYFVSERSQALKNSTEASLLASYLGVKSQLKETQTHESTSKQSRALPPELTPSLLAKLMGAKRLCWVIEDFHKVEGNEKTKLAQFMKIFMDFGMDYPDLKIIALGAVETARQVVEYDQEMRNRIAEIEVPLMSEEEIRKIIEKGAKALNLIFPVDVQKVVSQYSSGLAAVAHQLCLNMCSAAGISHTAPYPVTITVDNLEKAITRYVEECSDTIRSNFEKARKVARKTAYKHADLILDALSTFGDKGAARSEILAVIKRSHDKYTDTMLKAQLNHLQDESRGGLLRHSQNSGLYSFSDPVYRVFAKTLFHKNGHIERDTDFVQLDLPQLVRLLERELGRLDSAKTEQPKMIRVVRRG